MTATAMTTGVVNQKTVPRLWSEQEKFDSRKIYLLKRNCIMVGVLTCGQSYKALYNRNLQL